METVITKTNLRVGCICHLYVQYWKWIGLLNQLSFILNWREMTFCTVWFTKIFCFLKFWTWKEKSSSILTPILSGSCYGLPFPFPLECNATMTFSFKKPTIPNIQDLKKKHRDINRGKQISENTLSKSIKLRNSVAGRLYSDLQLCVRFTSWGTATWTGQPRTSGQLPSSPRMVSRCPH